MALAMKKACKNINDTEMLLKPKSSTLRNPQKTASRNASCRISTGNSGIGYRIFPNQSNHPEAEFKAEQRVCYLDTHYGFNLSAANCPVLGLEIGANGERICFQGHEASQDSIVGPSW